jgi:hypothetical protein
MIADGFWAGLGAIIIITAIVFFVRWKRSRPDAPFAAGPVGGKAANTDHHPAPTRPYKPPPTDAA